VTVEDSAGPAVSTDAASNASAVVLRGSDLDALSDNPDDLLVDLQALAGPAAGPNGGSIFIDGFSGGELPPKNAIREIRINQNPFSPEYDKLGFGLTCPRFLYQPKVEFPWVDHTPFVALRTLPPSPSSQQL
jgi:hypothetical protein